MLSAAQVEFYHQNGFVVAERVLDGATLSALRQKIAEVVEGARGVTTHNEVYDLEPTHRPDSPRVRRIKTPHIHLPLFRDLTRDPRIVSIVRQLLGPSVRLHGSKINIKAPEYGSPVEWHQDWAFYPHTNDDILAVGVMLDDCEMENGPLMIVPGTHKGPTWDHHAEGRFCGAIDPNAVPIDFAKAVPLTAPAGSMSFHHVRAVHGSALNTSRKSRTLLLYEYAATDAWPLMGVANFDDFNARIVAGEPTIVPRFVDTPVRMPLPPAINQGSIYENQVGSRKRYFETAVEKDPALAGR